MPTTTRHHVAAAVTAVALVALTACSGSGSGETGGTSGTSSPDDAIDQFHSQEINFGSCEGQAPSDVEEDYFVDPFECGSFEVPLDYDDPGGKSMQIGVMRLPAKGAPEDRIGSLVLNPGGPGGPGTVQTAIAAAGLKDSEVLERFDVVGFDPRGVGTSEPAIKCFTNEEQDANDNQTTLIGSTGEWGARDTERLKDRCAEHSGGEDVLGAVGTRNVARDLDILRDVLGDDKLTFAGQSYGTRLGAVYAEMFGNNVRAMVLDGALDPRLDTAERRRELHAGFQRSFDLMAESCADGGDCPLGDDPGRATEEFQDLVRPLIDEPVPAGDGRELGFNQATGAVTAALYYSEQWPAVIEGIKQLKDDRRGDQLIALGDAFGTRAPSGDWNNQTEANLATNCNDENRRTPEEEEQLRRDTFEASPYMDPGRPVEGVTRDACEAWPSEPSLEYPHSQDVETPTESLVISVTGDPATPFEAGESLADSVGGSLLEVEGERHTVFQAGISPCVNDVTANYLVDLELPEEGKRCKL
ncbi:MAG: alpha/beta fold hydrolase [Mycobacteriaceae bacterium]|uniref:alpha/beta fold hydrolase n=1 Tax=Corynebacterium sp. TaxID=1720 RepID=UPI003F99CA6B